MLTIYFILFYFIGSLPSGFVISKLFYKLDLRQFGSGNIGATNAARLGGFKLGILVFLCDGLKVILAVFVGLKCCSFGALVLCLAVFFGHLYPVFLKFKGGKGVAVTVFALFMLDFRLGLCFGIVWLIVFCITKYASAASISAALFVYLLSCILLLYYNNIEFNSFAFIAISTGFVIIKHIPNIKRLYSGQELKFGKK